MFLYLKAILLSIKLIVSVPTTFSTFLKTDILKNRCEKEEVLMPFFTPSFCPQLTAFLLFQTHKYAILFLAYYGNSKTICCNQTQA
jgi:hypothetical protein